MRLFIVIALVLAASSVRAQEQPADAALLTQVLEAVAAQRNAAQNSQAITQGRLVLLEAENRRLAARVKELEDQLPKKE